MNQSKTYLVELTVDEFNGLQECLKELRQRIGEEHQQSGFPGRREPINDPVFVAASTLAYKLAKIENPTSSATLQEYLNYGSYGLNN